jgi:hypothetical protein
MPKKKITLEEAYAVFEQHGLEVEVKAIAPSPQKESLASFLDIEPEQQGAVIAEDKRTLKITLYAAHTIGNGGETITERDGTKHVVNNGIVQYGPGVVTVPLHLAQHLLHQDLLARRGDERMLDNRMRTYVVRPMRTSQGTINVARQVSNDTNFDFSGFLGKLGEGGIYQLD